ncbi:hypothetical protein I552_10050 [Mycobacterium xenopi 3993]|nr:hypothetical protein I552_10050 [Mycobacterium xenopi 3993]
MMTMPTPTTMDTARDTKRKLTNLSFAEEARVLQRRNGEPGEQAEQKQDQAKREQHCLHGRTLCAAAGRGFPPQAIAAATPIVFSVGGQTPALTA